MGTVLALGFLLILAPEWTKARTDLKTSHSPLFVNQFNGTTAEIRCGISMKEIDGLYLYRKFTGSDKVMFLYIRKMEAEIHENYSSRLNYSKTCCDFLIKISKLRPDDSDVYYCRFKYVNMSTHEEEEYTSTGTLVMVTEQTFPDCPPDKQTRKIVLILILTVVVIVICMAACFCVWNITGKQKTFEPKAAKQYRPRKGQKPQQQQRINFSL
ncbi:uncharacterized protein LOC120517611 isoform X2 [Polypterus senegalus]|uniref:uncharacterized protein LOC120517611 isoform X2 n=1 Tax=Polypterus senegalus TaxID=55291 RepID=UPI0019664B68|nr:uncharacterized protein LOC120517611 isoform X2 [Polypterus senegalus]